MASSDELIVGGLKAASQPPAASPQQAGGNPLGMAKSATDAAIGAENFNENVAEKIQASNIGDQAFVRMLQERLMAGLPSAQEVQRARKQQQGLLQRTLGTLQPTERSGVDILAGGITAGLANRPELYQQGNLGAALASMGQGAAATDKAFEDRETIKAKAAYDLVDKDIDSQEKRMFDAVTRQQALRSKTGVEFRTLADGTVGVFDKSSGAPMGVYGPKQIAKVAELAGKYAQAAFEKGQYKTLDEAKEWGLQEALRAVGTINESVGNTTAAKPTTTTPAATETSAPAAPVAQDPMKVSKEVQAGRDSEAYEVLKSEIAAASKANNRADVEALQKEMQLRFPNGKPTQVAAAPAGTMPKKDVVKEAGEKKLAERTAEVQTEEQLKAASAKGKAEGERAGAKPEEIASARTAIAQIDRLDKALQDAVALPGMEKVHGKSGYIPFVGDVLTMRGSDAQDYKSKLKTIKAQIGFQALQAMRDASKTGGALGNVTEKEIDFLQASLDSLDPEMSDEAAKKAYTNITNILADMKRRVTQNFETKYPVDKGAPTVEGALKEERKTVGGKQYVKKEDGKWYPMSN